MGRQRTGLRISVKPEHGAQLVDRGGPRGSDEMVLRVFDDSLLAYWPSRGNYSSPPRLQARIERRPDEVVIDGTVRESFTDAMWQPAFLGLTIFAVLLAAFGVVLIVTGQVKGGLPPLIIGVVAFPLAWLLWRHYRKIRKPGFDRQAQELETGLRDLLTTGTSSRYGL